MGIDFFPYGLHCKNVLGIYVFYHVGHTRVGYSAFGVDFTCTCERVTIILHVQFECKTI